MLAAETARGCASSAWALSVTACHAWILGMFPRDAQDEIWGDDPTRAVASSFLGVGPKLAPETGGIRLSGRWRFSSNVDHCGGAILLAMLPGPARRRRRSSCWCIATNTRSRTPGAPSVSRRPAATTSSIKDALVPPHRMLDVIATRDGRAPGAAGQPAPSLSPAGTRSLTGRKGEGITWSEIIYGAMIFVAATLRDLRTEFRRHFAKRQHREQYSL